MKSINVSNANNETAKAVWYEPDTGRLCVVFGSILRAILLNKIALEDFESKTPIVSFSIEQTGSVISCRHEDGEETWLPVDMWQPRGFTPKKQEHRGRARKSSR